MRVVTRVVASVTLITVVLTVRAMGMPVAAAGSEIPADHTPRRGRAVAVHQADGPRSGAPSPTSRIGRRAMVPDRAAYARAKAALDSGGETAEPPAEDSDGHGPATIRSWQGINQLDIAPSDSTGAIGTTRYVELVNARFAIYDRTSDTPLSTGTLQSLVGGTGDVFDPQVIWDPDTERFYVVAPDVVDARNDNRLAVAFSTTDSPSSAADWCQYFLAYGRDFPDYPKLGDTADFWMAGINVFRGTAFVGTDLAWISKPPSGSTCPAADTFTAGVVTDLTNADGSDAWTPVPANQTDGDPTGHVVASRYPGAGSSNFLTVFDVTNAGGSLALGPPRPMTVAGYSFPANAPQPGTAHTLDTLDTRLTQAVSAIDPFRGGVAIWTQHTVFGGAGAEVRWYEIDPAPAIPVPFQSGKRTSTSLYLFNAAISPDRRVNGGSAMFGSAMALGFNQSSSTQPTRFVVATKVEGEAISPAEVYVTSTAPVDDFSCGSGSSSSCRWGDYAAATPDPASSTSEDQGQVWLTNAFSEASAGSNADWRTWNVAVRPQPK